MRRLYKLICILATSPLIFLVHPAAASPPDLFQLRGNRAAPHPYLQPALCPPPAIEPGDKDRTNGLILSTVDGQRCSELALRDCPGQYGSTTFIVTALRDGGLHLRMTELQGIPAENLDIRIVRWCSVKYRNKQHAIPLLIEKPDWPVLKSGQALQIWLTYFIPPGTTPGPHKATIEISLDGQAALAIPLQLVVYPFTLDDAPFSFYIYYNNPTSLTPQTLASIRRELLDQRLHGMNATTLVPPVTDAGELRVDAMAALLDLCRQAGFTRPIHIGLCNRITAEWLNTADRSIKMYGPWFRYYPFSEKLDTRFVLAVKTIHRLARERDLSIVIEVADEPGSHPWTTDAAQHYNDLLKREVPDVPRELTVGGGWAMNRPEHDLWNGRIDTWTTNRWLADKLDLVRKADPRARFQIYNMAGGGSLPGSPAPARCFYGFFAWKARVEGAAQWTYYHSGTPEDNYTWPAADPGQGSVPTVRWELAREGVKDRLYVNTLENRLRGRTGPLADQARRFLEEISSRIELKTADYDPMTGGRIPAPELRTMDAWRDRTAELIMRLPKK